MKEIKLGENQKTTLEFSNGGKLFMMVLGDSLFITPFRILDSIKVKKGSLKTRIEKGMATRSALKDLAKTAKGSATEALVLDISNLKG